MNFIYKNLLLVGILLLPFLGKAQFGYFGAGVGLRSTTFQKGRVFSGEKTKLNSLTFELNGMYRPLRFLGIGATVSFPVSQSSRYSFVNAETTNGDTFTGFNTINYGYSNDPDFFTKKFDYSFEQSAAVTFKVRFYVDPHIGVYFDLRYTIMTLTEKFVIQRDSQNEFIAEDFIHKEDMSLLIPGFGMGIHHHLSKHIYIDFSANFDFLQIQNKGFFKDVAYRSLRDDLMYVAFTDQTEGEHTSKVLQFSLGYIF